MTEANATQMDTTLGFSVHGAVFRMPWRNCQAGNAELCSDEDSGLGGVSRWLIPGKRALIGCVLAAAGIWKVQGQAVPRGGEGRGAAGLAGVVGGIDQ